MLCLFVLIFLFGVANIAVAGSGRESTNLPPQEIKIMYSSEDHGYQQKGLSGTTVLFKTLPDGSIVTQDNSGTTDFFVPSDRVVFITSVNQLKSWGLSQQATSGQSYYQCLPGKTYIVDPHSIATSGAGVTLPLGSTSAFGAGSVFSGVSMILPNASTYSGPAYDVTIVVAALKGDSYAALSGGATTVNVYASPGAGATTYGSLGSRATLQNMLRVNNASGVPTVGGVISGGSMWQLNVPGESATFTLYNGGVSSMAVKRHVYD